MSNNPKNELVSAIDRQLARVDKQLVKLLPSHMDGEKFVQTIFWAVKSNPKLMQVFRSDAVSIVGAVLECAEMGLVPNTARGECWLIPYNENKKQADGKWQKVLTARLQPGYVGLRKLAMQNPEHKRIWADLVYEGDDYEITLLPERGFTHRPGPRYGDEESIGAHGEGLIGAYAAVTFASGGWDFEWRPIASLNKVRDAAKKRNGGEEGPAWREWPAQMYKKTALTRFCKSLEIGPEAARLVQLDDRLAANKPQNLGAVFDGESSFEGWADEEETGETPMPETLPADGPPPALGKKRAARLMLKLHNGESFALPAELVDWAKDLDEPAKKLLRELATCKLDQIDAALAHINETPAAPHSELYAAVAKIVREKLGE